MSRCPKSPDVDHDAVRAGKAAGRIIGIQKFDDGERMLLINCLCCGSTLCRELTPEVSK